MLRLMNHDTDVQTPVAVRDAATLALLRDGSEGLEVLLLRRHPGHVFGANAHVFPGGACDEDDVDALGLAGTGADLDDARFRVAALRECFEEAGLLAAMLGALPAYAASVALRSALNNAELRWSDLLASAHLQMDLAALVRFADWTTPAGAPKRYATRFYAALAPLGQSAEADGAETVSARWIRPAEALIEADTGRRHLMRPTRASLKTLAGFPDAASALIGLAALDSAVGSVAGSTESDPGAQQVGKPDTSRS